MKKFIVYLTSFLILMLMTGCAGKMVKMKSLEPVDVEIVYDEIIYYVPCEFFKFKLNYGTIIMMKSENSDNVYYISDDDIINEMRRYNVYKNTFNERIIDASKPKINYGIVNDTNNTVIRELVAKTENTTCYKFKYSFDRNVFVDEDENLIKIDKELFDNFIEGFDHIKSEYNEGKVD